MRTALLLTLLLATSACPRGRTGPACDQPAWPACTVGGIAGDCRTPNTCDCFRECDAQGFLHRFARVCYNVSEPTSVDDLVSAPSLLFQPAHPLPAGAADCGFHCDPGAKNQVIQPDARDKLVPLSKCASGCSGRGFCFADETCRCFHDDESPQTDMAFGPDCSSSQPAKQCLNNCSGKGSCFNGVCVCAPERDGADCGLPLTLR